MKKINLGIIGAGGRIGLELLKLVNESDDFIAKIGVGNKSTGFIQNLNKVNEIKSELIDLLIDFSSPELLEDTLSFCISNSIPLVSGTTGLSQIHFKLIQEAGESIPILWAPNMSLGVAILKKSLSVFASAKNFDFQIEEWHHRNKKDRPSGTALFLQEELEKVIQRQIPQAMVMRSGGIYGVHKIYAVSEDEMIVFEHTAMNRAIFARGALVAAKWLVGKKNGCYSMDDVIS